MEILKNDFVIYGSIAALAVVGFFPQLVKLFKSFIPQKKVDPLGSVDDDTLDFAAYVRLKRRAEGRGIEAAVGPLNLILPAMFGPSMQRLQKPPLVDDPPGT